ncbi:hypothetical protein FRB93_001062 [Tulasnella sp. JGI-2019a]|nr:hypothetical protein FRB93_001062 [Tulasnella sp. JGI-2019a]
MSSSEPPVPGGHLSPHIQDAENPSTSGSSSSMRVPSILHTAPSTWNLTSGSVNAPANNNNNGSVGPDLDFGLDDPSPPQPGIRTPSSTESSPRDVAYALPEIPPRGGEGDSGGRREAEDQPGTSPPRRPFSTVPFPKRNSSNKSLNSGLPATESNLSEQPDMVASLSRTVPAPGFLRGRRYSRTSGGRRPSLTRRASSDPEDSGKVDSARILLPALSPSSSREQGVGTSTPKRVSFDNESLQHGATSSAPADLQAAAERRDVSSGLKRISSSLERIKQHFSRPRDEPILPLHNDPHDPPNPSTAPSSRAQSPTRLFDRRRNNAFWPARPLPNRTTATTGRSSKFNPCDPYDPPSYRGRRSRYVMHNDNGMFNPCMCMSYFSETLVHYVPSLETTVYFVSLSVRQIYRHVLLRLPSLYFSRVWRIIFEAQVSHAELENLIVQRRLGTDFPINVAWVPPVVPPGLARFKGEWEEFIDQLVKEWKTFNVVSALLLSAILTIFQVNDTVQPVTRTAALASLVAGLFSLVYGGVYVVRFQSMKSMVKASRWAEAAQSTTTGILWNVWVFLSLPAVALAYAIIFFCISVMSYVWTAGSTNSPGPIREDIAWVPRMVITILFAISLMYFYMVIVTFQSYSDPWPSADPSPAYSDHAPNGVNNGTEDNHQGQNGGRGGDRGRGMQPNEPGEGSNGNVERGRDPDMGREARQRRLSLKRFGSPDILSPRLSPSAKVSQTVSLPDLVLSDKLQHQIAISRQEQEQNHPNGTTINNIHHIATSAPPSTNAGGFVSPSLEHRRQMQEALNNLTYDPHRSSPNIGGHGSLGGSGGANHSIPILWQDRPPEDTIVSRSPPTYTGGGQLELRTSRRSEKGSPLKSDVQLSPAVEDEEDEDEDSDAMELVGL